ncbi:hypothetical protein [Streptomyces sp. TRM70350]|uniref:hypothetical protein n=1 Tax=Streptomyces sp. TRM70350 TaxID=2856165 RepID=UPI0035A85FAB
MQASIGAQTSIGAQASEGSQASEEAQASEDAEEGVDRDEPDVARGERGERGAARDEHSATQDQPGTAQNEHSPAQNEHSPAQEQPGTAQNEHSPAQDQPSAAQDQPGTAQDQHSAARGVARTGEGDAPGARRPVRRRSPAVIASVAAAVLLVGGGGAYLTASAGGGSGGGTGPGAPAGNGTPPPLALDGYSSGAPNGIAPGEPDPNGVTYWADDRLPTGPRSAAVHWPQGEVTKEEVARLAEALDLAGTPVAEGQAWRIGGQDGQGPGLQVNRQAPGTWTFHRYAPGTDNCQGTTACAKNPSAGSADPVSEEAARKAAAPILKAVGQDSAKVDAGQVMGARRVVNADPVVGGLPTYGWPTGVTVGAQGEVVAASGQLTAPVKGATYPVLSAERTLELMNAAQAPTPRGGIGGCTGPVPLEEDEPCEEARTAPPPRERIVVEDAVFGLASHTVDARPALVPSWLFEVRAPGAQDGFTVTYPAIDPKYLTRWGGESSPRPSDPGDAPRTRDVRVEGYTAEGRELTVSFTGGVCADYEAKAVEGPDKVTVTVTEKPWPDKVCILIAKVHYRTVQLDEPLGDRKVVGSDGESIPLLKPGARLPG